MKLTIEPSLKRIPEGRERSQQAETPSTFLPRTTYQSLPLELREMIVEHAMRKSGHLNNVIRVLNGVQLFEQDISKVLPPICIVSEQSYQDAFPIFARNAWWDLCSVNDTRYFENFLNKVPLGLNKVRQIIVQDFGELPMNFLSSLPNLRRVKIVVHLFRMRDPGEPPRLLTRRWSREEIVRVYHMDRIFDLPHLERVDFHIEPAFQKSQEILAQGGFREMLEDLRIWIRDEYYKRSSDDPQWRRRIEVGEIMWPISLPRNDSHPWFYRDDVQRGTEWWY